MNILIIEDDLHKYDDIKKVIKKIYIEATIVNKDSVRDSIIYLEDNRPDKIFLDMSLPSHKMSVGDGAPLPMPVGGIEVLMELSILGRLDTDIFILTQYKEIEIESEYLALSEAAEEIKRNYGMNNISVALYGEDNNWITQAERFLKK